MVIEVHAAADPDGCRLVDEQWFVERRYEQDPREIAKKPGEITISGDTSKGTATGARTAWASGQRDAAGRLPCRCGCRALAGADHPDSASRALWRVESRTACCSKTRAPARRLSNFCATTNRHSLAGDPHHAAHQGWDKVVRFAASLPAMRDGQVWLPPVGIRLPPAPSVRGGVLPLPEHPEKDQGDMVSQFLNWRRSTLSRPRTPRCRSYSAMWQNIAPALDADNYGASIQPA